MKPLFTLAIFIAGLFSANAQKANTVSIQSESQKIMIGTMEITSKTKIEDVLLYLGKPERVEKIAGKDRHYIYDSLGIAFDAGQQGTMVEALSINFNWDNDKKMARASFKNSLTLDNYSISEQSTSEMIKKNTNIKEIMCLGTLMCMSNPKSAGMALIIGYNKESKISQISFAFTVRQ